jgi:hypothetical protein
MYTLLELSRTLTLLSEIRGMIPNHPPSYLTEIMQSV